MKKEILFLVALIALSVFFAGCPENGNGGNGGTPEDTALSSPANVLATPKQNAIELTWEKIESSELKGYNIYRTLNSGKDYGKVNSYPITENIYRDEELAGGITYFYVVTSVNKADKESAFSTEVYAIPIVIEDKNNEQPYIQLCNKEPSQLKIDQCLQNYSLEFNNISACREMKELNVDACIKEIAVNLLSYDTCKEIKLKNVSIRDQCFYDIAVELKDNSGCTQIIDAAKTNTCSAIIAAEEKSIEACKKISVESDKDVCFNALAIGMADYVICTYISTAKTATGFKKDNCLETLLANHKEETLCTYFIDKDKTNSCYFEVGKEERNPLICKKSTDLNKTDNCIKEVAMLEEDSDYCLQIQNTNVFQECVIAVSEANPEKKACELITDLGTKDTCYYNTAKVTKKDSFCDLVIDNGIRDTCNDELAVDLNKSELCAKIRLLNKNLQNHCYETIAINTLNSSLCEYITGSDQYITCYKGISLKLTDYTVCNSATKKFYNLVYLTRDYCFYRYAEDTNESLACEQINNPGYRIDCDVNALGG